jgi:DNA-binding MarR family transcriptional regulator
MPKQLYKSDNFRLHDSIGCLLKHAHRAMHDRIEPAFSSEGITFQQWIVLMHLRDELACTVAELCRETRHDSGAMTRLIDQLEERGLIERERKRNDRRVIGLSLTALGRKTVESLIPIAVDHLNVALDGFSRQELTQLQEFLRRIMGRLRDLEQVEQNAEQVAVEPKRARS